jgi:hypothetical protein
VARLLGFFFVRAKIEEHIGVGHRESLRCAQPQVKMGVGLARLSGVLHASLQTGNNWCMLRSPLMGGHVFCATIRRDNGRKVTIQRQFLRAPKSIGLMIPTYVEWSL